MEGGCSSSAGGSGEGDLGAAQEPREEDEVGRRSGGGGMRARVCARVRTPQGVGALLVFGGAIVGAAVVAWRRRHHARRRDDDDGKGGKNHPREQPAKEEVLDGGVVEDEQQIQGKFDQSGENLSRDDDTGVGANGLDGKATEELHQIHNGKATKVFHEIQEEDEIFTDESGDGPVEKFDENSSKKCVEIIADDMGSEDVKKADENSNNSGIESEITPNATEDVENSDQSTLSISSQEITHEEHNKHSDGAQDAASTHTTPTTQMMMHQQQILEELKSDTVTETAEAVLVEGTAMKKNVSEQEEQKLLAEPVELISSPVISSLPSLLKPAEKKGPANLRLNETGMKLDQDCTNFELSKGRATQGVAVVTMDRRTASMAILGLIFAVTIGVNIVVRLYSCLQAT